MKSLVKFLLFFLLLISGARAFATHYRAGEILYTHIGTAYEYQVMVITYTKISGTSQFADRDVVQVSWGDGAVDSIPRVNGPIDAYGYPGGVVVLPDVKKNIYVGTHTYPGTPTVPPGAPPGTIPFYILSFYDQNRLAEIANIAQGNSVNIPFYVEDTIFFPASLGQLGQFSSPVLANPAVQYAPDCDTFYTNPEAIDSAADSITYVLVNCLQSKGTPVPQYIFPDAYCNSIGQLCSLPANACTIDLHTGNFTWIDPCATGFYNVGILMHIYRHGVCLSTMLRDFQIIVQPYNVPIPDIQVPDDTCIWAGSTLIERVSGHDDAPASPGGVDSLFLSAQGDPFVVPYSPAIFDTAEGYPSVSQLFKWSTVCNDIQLQPYFVYFKVEDNSHGVDPVTGLYTHFSLANYGTWRIYVIPPPVTGLTATATHNSVILNWHNPYLCDTIPNFHGFSVWRRVGCDPFIPDHCETGLAGTGYVKITANNVFNYTYTDNTVTPGQAYSYRVMAEFFQNPPDNDSLLAFNFQESVPSDEVCVNAPVDVPVILNVDVMQTDPVNGQIWVRWFKPVAGGINLDTLADPPQYRFDLYLGTGFTFGAPQILVNTWIYNTFSSIPDTVSAVDSGLNTVTGPWSYKVYFYAANNQSTIDTVGASASASSIFLTIQPSDSSLYLHWNYNVPWTNDSFSVWRQSHVTGLYDSIGIAYSNLYINTGLDNDTTYCYYIRGFGAYTATIDSYPAPLINRSERVCNAPVDTVPPCPPALTVTNDCGNYINAPWDTNQYINHLAWQIISDSCDINLQYFNIYFSPNDSNNYSKIDSLVPKTDTTFNHILNGSLAGCYAITAVSRAGFESKYSNVVCVDNCPYYVLPNAFTPNGDGHNDLFHPFLPYRFVTKIDMKIYNRWGELVFQTNDPMINWDGNDLQGKPVSEGVYLYAGYYYEQRLGGVVRKPLSGEKKGGGFIQLIRK